LRCGLVQIGEEILEAASSQVLAKFSLPFKRTTALQETLCGRVPGNGLRATPELILEACALPELRQGSLSCCWITSKAQKRPPQTCGLAALPLKLIDKWVVLKEVEAQTRLLRRRFTRPSLLPRLPRAANKAKTPSYKTAN
jgi:hypothetical protein